MAISDRIKKAWNAFYNREDLDYSLNVTNEVYTSNRPSLPRFVYGGEKTIISSIYTRLAMDVAEVEYRHVVVDKDQRYLKDVDSALNDAFLFETNVDQTPKQFRQDLAMTLFCDGVAAVVPVDTTISPETNQTFDIYTLRVGKVVTWYPDHVKVSVYDEKSGDRKDIILEKRFVAIVENPFYSVMNEQNSTLQRLIRKLALLDIVDENASSGKLDLIIQLPYVIKSEARKEQAEQRRKDIEFQLKSSQYGIAYTDGTEKITQLNRPAENDLLNQVKYLTAMLYQQLGLTEDIMNGTADEKTMLNYQNRTVIPIVDGITKSLQRSLLGIEKYKKNERIMYFTNPFKFVPLANIAEISDKFTRNEIATANEIRGIIGFAPSNDPKADELRNSNMPLPNDGSAATPSSPTANSDLIKDMDSVMNEVLDGLESEVTKLSGGE